LEKKTLFQIGNLIAVVLTVIVNALSAALPINGITPGEISDAIPNLFVPAGITFSIWSVIYVLLFLFAFYQAKDLFKKEKEELPFLDQIGIFFIVASIANISWIFFWHYLAFTATYLSLIAMLILLVSLLLIYLRLDIGHADVPKREKYFVYTTFSVYLGWITVATIANVTAVLVQAGWDGSGLSEALWTDLVIIVGTLITVLMLLKRKDIAYSLVVVWAYAGILIKRLAAAIVFTDIIITTAICTAIIVVFIVLTVIRTWKKTE
jgi:hypothetical protein